MFPIKYYISLNKKICQTRVNNIIIIDIFADYYIEIHIVSVRADD